MDSKTLERWVRAEGKKAKLPRLQSLHLVSCRSGVGLRKLVDVGRDIVDVAKFLVPEKAFFIGKTHI